MSDRWVFLAAFLTLVLVVASAFAVPVLFYSELLTSIIFAVVAIMVFFGEDRFPYMLGMVAPVLWFIYAILSGALVGDLTGMFRFLGGKPMGPLETPLHGFAILAGLGLVVFSASAWRKQVTEKFLGKTFALALVVGLIWIGAVAGYQMHALAGK